jgi:hypothetical protein
MIATMPYSSKRPHYKDINAYLQQMATRRSKSLINEHGSMLFNLHEKDGAKCLTLNIYICEISKNTILHSADWKYLQMCELGMCMGDQELFRLADQLDFKYENGQTYLFAGSDKYLIV